MEVFVFKWDFCPSLSIVDVGWEPKVFTICEVQELHVPWLRRKGKDKDRGKGKAQMKTLTSQLK